MTSPVVCPRCKSENISTHSFQGERLVADGKLHCGECGMAFADPKATYDDPEKEKKQ